MIKIDSSSLILALQMNFIPILTKLYKELVITKSVYEEVIIDGKEKGKEEAFIGDKLIKEKELTIHQVKEELMDLKLGKGETEIIHNSIELNCSCLMEDKKAKKIPIPF